MAESHGEGRDGGWPSQASAQALHTAAFYSPHPGTTQGGLEPPVCQMDFKVFLCGYGVKVPAKDFYLDVLKVAYNEMAGALAYFKFNLLLQW